MNDTSTFHLLLRFYYNETQAAETVSTLDAMDADPLVKSEFEDMVHVLSQLDNAVCEEPSEHIISNILAYSAAM